MGIYLATGELGASESNPEDADMEQGAFKLRSKAECGVEFYPQSSDLGTSGGS